MYEIYKIDLVFPHINLFYIFFTVNVFKQFFLCIIFIFIYVENMKHKKFFLYVFGANKFKIDICKNINFLCLSISFHVCKAHIFFFPWR